MLPQNSNLNQAAMNLLRLWKEKAGQDLIEYALMSGFVAAVVGAIMPGAASSISTIFSKVSSRLIDAATQSS